MLGAKVMTDEEFRALVAAGPAVVMVEKGHMIGLLDERDRLAADVTAAKVQTQVADKASQMALRGSVALLNERDRLAADVARLQMAASFAISQLTNMQPHIAQLSKSQQLFIDVYVDVAMEAICAALAPPRTDGGDA